MSSTTKVTCMLLPCLALLTLGVIPQNPLLAQSATHVVISEFATRGPSGATDEFVELYNPLDSGVNIAGWKLQYKSATGTIWSDRGVLPAGTVIPGHGFYLLAPTAYVGTVIPDFVAAAWTSGLADNGNIHIVNDGGTEIDRVGYGTGNDPEGTDAPNHGTTTNNNSVERKASASSTADSLAPGGLHVLLGNGYDSNNNGNDFVARTAGRDPQNSLSPPEPKFGVGGNGTGRAIVTPQSAYGGTIIPLLTVTVRQDSAYSLSTVTIVMPAAFTWSHDTSDITLVGTGAQDAHMQVSGDSLRFNNVVLASGDSLSVTIAGVTAPSSRGTYPIGVLTGVGSGTPASIAQKPAVRVLVLTPIVFVHVNDANGVSAPPYPVASEATVTGVVTGLLSDVRTDFYIQDATGGINIYNASLPPFPIARGDSITVTGSITQFRGLTEITADFNLLERLATNRSVPDPLVLTCAQVNQTFQPDYTEPNEGRLVRINGVSYSPATSTITDASGTTAIFVPTSFPTIPGVFDVIGILKQYKPGTPAPPPPYIADYEICPRDSNDIINHPGPIIVSEPYEDSIRATSVRLNWLTSGGSTSMVWFGTTTALGDSTEDTLAVTSHRLVLTGLQPATVYYYRAGGRDANGVNYSPSSMFSTASPAQTTGAINVFFNKSVQSSLAWDQPANGSQDLTQRIVTRINGARRSIDVALYSLSGTPGLTIANALVAAKQRGIRVRVINEYDNRNGNGFGYLVSNQVPLINDTYDAANAGLGLMHNKFFVVDAHGAPDSAWVWTGSWNPTDPGTNGDCQNAIELQDIALANAYTMEFEEMWGSNTTSPNSTFSRFGARKTDNTPHRFVIGGSDVESYFSPSDRTTSHLVAALNAAGHSIAFGTMTITRSDVSSAIIAVKNAGKAVRGIVDNNTDSGTQYNTLLNAGVDVLLKPSSEPYIFHHKYAVVDGENPSWNPTLITGSHNWSNSAETQNNENTLFVHNGNIANQYLQEFAARYAQYGGTNPITVGVDEKTPQLPLTMGIEQNYPNPFNPVTQIDYTIGDWGRSVSVQLSVYDLLGRQVAVLVNERQAPGRYQVRFDGARLASGVYLYRLQCGSFVAVKRMMLVK